MLRNSSISGGSGGGGGGGGGGSSDGTKHTHGQRRHHSKPHMGSLSAGSTKTWDIGRNSKTHNSLSSMGLTSRLMGAPGVDPEYVMQLVNDVRWFADVLLNLKEVFLCKESQEDLQQVVQERLAELLRVLKAVIGKHQTLNSVDILGKAGTVIAKVKGVNFKEVNPENKKAIFGEIHASIDTLAFIFGNVVSDFLMGDVDSGSGLGIPPNRRSRSFDNLSVDPEGYASEKNDLMGPEVPLSREEEVDLTLLKNDSGVESALLYAKAWSKYIKDLLACMEKRLALDIEYAKSYIKMAESAKTLASQQDYMPFSDIYVSTFKNEIEYNHMLVQSAVALQTNKFIQPLLTRKNELDKLRKEIKEQWQKEQKKMQEAEASLRKARALKAQRREEYQKAHSSTSRSQEEQSNAGNKHLEKKRRLEEEALQKAEEAQEQYQICLTDAGDRKMDMANAKSTILTQIREMVFQCDLTLKAVTVNWFQIQQAQTVTLPAHYQALSENAKLYIPGECYSEFVRNLPRNLHKERLHSDSDNTRFVFNKRSVGSTHSSHGNLSQASITSCDVLSGDEVDSLLHRPAKIRERRSNSSTDIQGLRSQAPLRAWASSNQGSQGGMCSDSESAGGSSESRSMDSPTASPGDFKRRLPRTPSTGTMSSADDLDEREPPSPSDNGLAEMVTETASSPGPFRNAQMSKAAQTHKLRKLRAPSKCRECDSLVVFHGAECEECSLACHKKCLETLAIQCGHKKLQGRLQLFGIDFSHAAKNNSDGVPFIIKKCTSEIESRALNIKGIYRVNGAKSRVEKLCQAFENGKDLVELSDLSPHDISNVLKLYLRQLPEPLILYRYYNDIIGLAKECQRVIVEEADKQQGTKTGEKCDPSVNLNRVIFKIRDLLCQLPPANYKTLRYLIAHLNKVTEQADENKMTASNLGIIFGPTLVKPRQTDAEVSLSSLVDYPYQALMVELLVKHFKPIFDMTPMSCSEIAITGQVSPRLTPQEKLQRLNRHSASMVDIKENAKVFKRFSSVIPSSYILNEVQEVQPGIDRTDASASDRLNGIQTSSQEEVQRSTLVFGRPSTTVPSTTTTTTTVPPKVQLRTQRTRHVSRPISMPLERLPAPAQLSERNNRNAAANTDASSAERDPVAETILEMPEPEKVRQSGSSRISTYYITPFMDTQTMQRRTWDRKYKHCVTPRTAKIMANLPPNSSGVQPIKASIPVTAGPAVTTSVLGHTTSSVSTMFPSNPCTMSVKPVWTYKRENDTDTSVSESRSSPNLPLTLRAPRTLQPPPGTFYKPPISFSRARTLPNWTTTVATITTTTTTTSALNPTSPTSVITPSPTLTSPPQTLLQTQDSTDSAIDPGTSTSTNLSPPQSPPPSSPDDLSPSETKPVYQRLRPRRLQELEHREAHFV